MDSPRFIQALEQRVGILEDQRRAWKAKSYEMWLDKLEKVKAYDGRFRALMKEHEELQEAWDSFACLYQIACGGNKSLFDEASKQRENGCYLCWSEDEIVENERADRERRRSK